MNFKLFLDEVVLPKKGKLSQKDKQIEHSEEFIEVGASMRRLNQPSMRLKIMPWIDALIMVLSVLSGMSPWQCWPGISRS